MDAGNPAPPSRPSWQPEPCPEWCTRVHREADHPEDRIHQDDGVLIPAILARVDPVDLTMLPVASELLVQRSQAVGSDAQVWVYIGETETAQRMILAHETIPRLRAGLP